MNERNEAGSLDALIADGILTADDGLPDCGGRSRGSLGWVRGVAVGIGSLVSGTSLPVWPLDGAMDDLTCRSLGIFESLKAGWAAVGGGIGGVKWRDGGIRAFTTGRLFRRTLRFLVL